MNLVSITTTQPADHPKCVSCGNNPVPHFLNWYFESINILFAPIRRLILDNPIAMGLRQVLGRLRLGSVVASMAARVGIIRYNSDRLACTVSRAQVLWEEAERRGVVMRELLLFGKPFDTYDATKKELTIVFSGLPRPGGYDNSSLEFMDDKLALKNLLRKAAVPIPAGGAAAHWSAAKAIFSRISKPVIVKPRAGSRGRHSTTFIYTEDELRTAFESAKKLCYWVIVEEQLFGPVYRGTVINYELGGVLRGDAPHITGDGTHTVAELVREKNSRSHEGVQDIKLSPMTDIFLSRQHLTVRSIPSVGTDIFLTEKIGVNYGGSSSEDYDICHADTKELFVAAAKAVGDPIVGFDFIIPDITQSYKEQRCGFLEANSLPFINLHHDPLLGVPRNVARMVWALVGF